MRAGFLLFPQLTQLDLTGPYEVLTRLPGAEVHLIWKSHDPVRADSGLMILPTTAFDDCPKLDVFCIPGGPGVSAVMENAEVLAHVRRLAASARYVTSVCTGSLVLGAAGLLRGRRATCHWLSRELLAEFGAVPEDARVVHDGNLITGGGVTAGIDFALTIVAELAGAERAQMIQLAIEYDPAPPFAAGSPKVADPALVERVQALAAARQRDRADCVRRAAARMPS